MGAEHACAHCHSIARFTDSETTESEIQRRGRWVTSCWKIYTWMTRRRDTDVANRMTQADDLQLQIHLAI